MIECRVEYGGTSASVWVIGTSIGPYRVISRLGAGGMGEVFLGRDTRLDRKVALKRLTRELDDLPAMRERVLAEARAAARLSHPHIAAIYDVVEHEGQPFIVMEYVTGETLAARLARGRLAIPEVVAIGGQLASALAAAHAHGVIHRDLKPGNVQLAPDGSVKVLDFGIARVAPQPASTSAATATGIFTPGSAAGPAGTPGYMSPEQLLNDPIDARSDVYSLGVILFEMAVGRPPYVERDAIGRAMAIAAGAPPPADAVNPDVPRALAAIIAKALARQPGDRYATARALERALAVLEAPAASAAAPPAAPARIARATLARRAAAVLVGAPVAMALLGLASTAMFNAVLQRQTPFGRESLSTIVEYGARSLVAPAFYVTAAAVAFAAGAFLVRIARLAPAVDRALTTSGARTRHAAVRLRFDEPAAQAQAIAAAGAIAIGLVGWSYLDLILAFTSRISDEPVARFALLAPDNARYKDFYGIVLDVLTVVFATILARVARRRRGTSAVAVSGAVVLILVLMNGLPYRVLWQNAFERVDYGGARCYAIGEAAAERLLFCPDHDPPRNRVIDRADPAAAPTGVVESIFTAAGR